MKGTQISIRNRTRDLMTLHSHSSALGGELSSEQVAVLYVGPEEHTNHLEHPALNHKP